MNETELLFTEVLKTDRMSLLLDKCQILDKEHGRRIAATLSRRAKGEPIQYILGKTEFMGLEFAVGPGVLIPRPETEILVEKAVEIACSFTAPKILDLCTGSGCIAVSMAKNLPQAQILAMDISIEALTTARHNAAQNSVNVDFSLCDLFAACRDQYDIIISNPPYIPSAQISQLQPEIQFEPRIALDGGEDGMDFYRRIAAAAPAYLKRGGFLLLEAGFDQALKIKNIIQKTQKFEIIEVAKDYNHIERVITARLYN